jgi:hypothetical protein
MSEPCLRVHRMAGLWETKDARPEAKAERESLPIIIFFSAFFYGELGDAFFLSPNAWIRYRVELTGLWSKQFA